MRVVKLRLDTIQTDKQTDNCENGYTRERICGTIVCNIVEQKKCRNTIFDAANGCNLNSNL